MSPFSPAGVCASLRAATSFQAIRPYLRKRLELMTRPPSVAVDLTQPDPSSAPWTTPRPTMRTVSHRRGDVVRHKKTGDLTSATGSKGDLQALLIQVCSPLAKRTPVNAALNFLSTGLAGAPPYPTGTILPGLKMFC